MIESNAGQPRGILHPKAGENKGRLSRHLPADDLGFFVEHFWIVNWDLRGQAPHRQETLPHPSVHLVIEKGQSRLVGVARGKFSRLLEDQGRVFGIKFRPGAFYPFVKSPMTTLTDRTVKLDEVFGLDGKTFEAAMLALDDEKKMIECAEHFLRERLPERNENAAAINRIVERIIADREIIKVDDMVSRFKINKRTLQRLFRQCVGVSPKKIGNGQNIIVENE